MKILVYGAGVIGSIYACKLHMDGHHVVLLARPPRAEVLRQIGVILERAPDGERLVARIPVCDRLLSDDEYDLILIAVRRDQIESVIPEIAGNRRASTILLMLNYPLGIAELAGRIGTSRVIVGFPGAGGWRDGNIVRYSLIRQQLTMIGHLAGEQTAHIQSVAQVLGNAGFPVSIERNMPDWLAAHAFFITSVGGALYRNFGDCKRLAADQNSLCLMCQGVCDGFRAVQRVGWTVRPVALKLLFSWMPLSFAMAYWRRFFLNPAADLVFGHHVRNARSEILLLAADCRKILVRAQLTSTALNILYEAITHPASPTDSSEN